MKTLTFNYYDEFACTGPECEDSCCKHWEIDLSKREYLDYKKMECSPELRATLDSAFKRTKTGNDYRYAKMNLREDGSCPFLGEDRLCMLQKEKGASALTVVCGTFPRNWCQIGNDAVIFALTPTCCHVVELLMKHPEGLILTEGEYDGTNRLINRNVMTAIGIPADSKILPYIWSIKTAQLDILQNRDFTIAERLLILGYYTHKACDYLENSPEKLDQLADMMLDRELITTIANSLKTPQTNVQADTRTVDMLFKLSLQAKKNAAPHINELLDIIGKSVELRFDPKDGGIVKEDLSIEYDIRFNAGSIAKNREIYSKIEAERPYIIENLLASLAFARFSKDEKMLWEDYFSMAELYNFLKTGLAAFLPENYTDKELAMGITNIVKILLNANLAKYVTMYDFAKRNANSLPYVAFLIS